jgi:aldehyde dehydrogenase (NAD+)
VLARILGEVFPEEEVAVVRGGVEVAQNLLALPFDHVFFTGSIPVGKIVMGAAAKTLASVTLELGGKSPTLVDETAELPLAVERILWAKFVNAGQTCVAPDYVWIHASRLQEFLVQARGVLDRFYGPDEKARRESPDLSRIVNDRNFVRLASALDESVAAGAKVEAGGVRDADERYIAPTLLSAVTWEMPIMREEIFGPILPILTYRDLDEVYATLRARDKPLALYVFTRDSRRAWEVIRNTTAGGTVVNNAVIHAGNTYLPFGGVGASGMGNYHGEHGFRTLSHERAVLVQGPFRLLRYTFPPYGKRKQTLVDTAIRLLSRY